MLAFCQYLDVVIEPIVHGTLQLQLLPSNHLVRQWDVKAEWQTDRHLNWIRNTNT